MITKKEALQECIRIWDRLYRTGSDDKCTVPGILDNTRESIYFNNCPCCEYAYDHNNYIIICDKCPLYHFWLSFESIYFIPAAVCEHYNTPYKKYAKQIRDASIKALKKLYKEDNKHGQ